MDQQRIRSRIMRTCANVELKMISSRATWLPSSLILPISISRLIVKENCCDFMCVMRCGGGGELAARRFARVRRSVPESQTRAPESDSAGESHDATLARPCPRTAITKFLAPRWHGCDVARAQQKRFIPLRTPSSLSRSDQLRPVRKSVEFCWALNMGQNVIANRGSQSVTSAAQLSSSPRRAPSGPLS